MSENAKTHKNSLRKNILGIKSVDLGGNIGTLKFSTDEEYKEFLAIEKKQWDWFEDEGVKYEFMDIFSIIIEQYHKLEENIEASKPSNYFTLKAKNLTAYAQQNIHDESWQDLMIDIFVQRKIPLSYSNIGKFIEKLRNESPRAAAAALSTWMSHPGLDWSDFEHVKGAMLVVAFDSNITNENLGITEKKLNNLNDDFTKCLTATRSEIQKTIYELNIIKDESIHKISKSVDRKYRAWRRFRTSKTDEIKNLIHQADNAEKGFREQMKLKAPVKYWSEKAQKHRISAIKFRNTLLWFSGIASFVLISCLAYIAKHVVEIATNEKPAAVYLTLVTLGVVLTTIVFWAARIIMRLFLSEHHLAIDAEERSVMTETYLALTADGHASETDRTIILSSLFRPTADGIVKDDAAPDLSPASLISRLASK